jgi:hypothetical protein
MSLITAQGGEKMKFMSFEEVSVWKLLFIMSLLVFMIFALKKAGPSP